MKRAVGMTLLIFAGLLGWGARHASVASSSRSVGENGRIPVLVELFTSEGCSSCPPADALLAKLEGQQPFASAEIIGIEEHVDYWDNLGWRDPFSSARWTARQYAYADALGNGNTYTPQMVVDGRKEFVGSNPGKARQAIEQAAATNKTRVQLSDISIREQVLTLKIAVDKPGNLAPGDTAEVLLAITERGLHSAVTRGENAGEDLHHASVLRELRSVGIADKNAGQAFTTQPPIKLDRGWNRESLRVVVFVQEKKSKRVLGAAFAALGQ